MGALRFLFALALSAALALRGEAQEPLWPMDNGSHDVLHSFQNPFSFGITYFHEGVDLRGSLDDVVAIRSGTVRYVNQNDSGGTLLIETPSGEADSYLHILIDPWQAGDPISAGDRVGRISDSYFATLLHDHVHVNRFVTWIGGSGYNTNRTNMLHPLLLFAGAMDHDPQLLPAAPTDANEDGRTFHVAPSNASLTVLPYAFGAVDLLLEATDRLSNSLYWDQGLLGVGYWIGSNAGGEDVASAAQPYRLVRFDDDWRSSHATPDNLLATVMLNSTAYRVELGPHDTGWYSLATYILTNTSGFTGAGNLASASQSWKTDARLATGSGNGTGGSAARGIQEARWPDGRYHVHALTEDTVGELDTVYDVVIDNFRPYLRRFHVRDAVSLEERFQGEWVFDATSGALNLVRDFQGAPDYRLQAGDQLELELEFSEPMADATLLKVSPFLGSFAALSSAQAPDERTLWTTTLVVSQIPAGPPLPRLSVSGHDLAGSTLFPFKKGISRPASFNKRTNAAPLDDPTLDILHVIPLARRRAPAGPPR